MEFYYWDYLSLLLDTVYHHMSCIYPEDNWLACQLRTAQTKLSNLRQKHRKKG